MNNKIIIVAILGATGVGLGAFGAHGLKSLLLAEQIDVFKTGTFYHFIHLSAMLAIVLKNQQNRVLNQCFYLFLAGIICFSGSLYILSTKHLYGGDVWNFVGPITPMGGLLFIAGWLNMVRYKTT